MSHLLSLTKNIIKPQIFGGIQINQKRNVSSIWLILYLATEYRNYKSRSVSLQCSIEDLTVENVKKNLPKYNNEHIRSYLPQLHEMKVDTNAALLNTIKNPGGLVVGTAAIGLAGLFTGFSPELHLLATPLYLVGGSCYVYSFLSGPKKRKLANIIKIEDILKGPHKMT